MSEYFGPYSPAVYDAVDRQKTDEDRDLKKRLQQSFNPPSAPAPVFGPSRLEDFQPEGTAASRVMPSDGPRPPAEIAPPGWETPNIRGLQDELSEAKARYAQNNDRLELREAIEKIAQGIGKFAAGWYGNKTNTDLSKAQFATTDWGKKAERLDNQQAQIEADIARRRAERQGEADRRNQRGFQQYQTDVNRDVQNRQLDLSDASRRDQVNISNARTASSENLSLQQMALNQLITMESQGLDRAKIEQQAAQWEGEMGMKAGQLLQLYATHKDNLGLEKDKFQADTQHRDRVFDENTRQADIKNQQTDRSLDQTDAKLDQDQRQFMTNLRLEYNKLDQATELKQDANKLEQRRLELMEKQIDGNLSNESQRIDAILAGQENDLKIAAGKFAAARTEAAIKKAGTTNKQWGDALHRASTKLFQAEKLEDADAKKNTVLNALAPLGVDTVELEKAGHDQKSILFFKWNYYNHDKINLLIRKIANAPTPPAGKVMVLDTKAKSSDKEYLPVTEEQYQEGLRANSGRLIRVRKSIYDPTESTP